MLLIRKRLTKNQHDQSNRLLLAKFFYSWLKKCFLRFLIIFLQVCANTCLSFYNLSSGVAGPGASNLLPLRDKGIIISSSHFDGSCVIYI